MISQKPYNLSFIYKFQIGNPVCLSRYYPHSIIQEHKSLKYFDNSLIDPHKQLHLQERILSSSSILTINSNLQQDSSITENLQLEVQTLENIVGFFNEETRVQNYYWLQYEILENQVDTQEQKVGLEKGEFINEDKYIIDFKSN